MRELIGPRGIADGIDPAVGRAEPTVDVDAFGLMRGARDVEI